jgi:hypothetical protein
MALQKQTQETVTIITTGSLSGVLSSKEGQPVLYPSAYHRVERVVGGKSSQTAVVATYTAKGEKQIMLREFAGLPVDTQGGNNIAQAYEALKQLPEFAGAVDV